MNIQENVSLRDYSTMRLGGNARYLTTVKNKEELLEAIAWAHSHHVKIIVIGGGSNIIWDDAGYSGLVIVNRILGYAKKTIDTTTSEFTFGAGENWDNVVSKTVEAGYSGLEQLSLIPGTVGGTPIQNVGAYGKEIKDVLTNVEAYDTQSSQFVEIPNDDCSFSYRNSRFKSFDKNRFYITSISVKLTKTNPTPPFYSSLQAFLDKHAVHSYTPQIIRDAVIKIRTSKLPDPTKVANNGSFFANPIISLVEFEALQNTYPDIPHWPTHNGKIKLSAAWLIEQSGFHRGYADKQTGMKLWDHQALVLVNDHASTTKDLKIFRDKIISNIKNKFGVQLVQEPEIIKNI